jgi:hypothetical protein
VINIEDLKLFSDKKYPLTTIIVTKSDQIAKPGVQKCG